MSASVEKCFEDAEESGCLQILHKGLKQFPVCVDAYDLLDVTTVGKLQFFIFVIIIIIIMGEVSLET